MKKLLLVSVAGVALVAAGAVNSADAADVYRKAPPPAPVAVPPPVFSWTGCFVGAQLGWGWGRKNVDSFEISDGVRDTFFGSGHIDTSGSAAITSSAGAKLLVPPGIG
jgi:outer membrane immunogenic protein